MKLIDKLNPGPLAVIGDVHGELSAMESLLEHLGFSGDNQYPENRRLVFAGDLVDRGPDNLAVVKRVQTLVEAGVAQCVLGNHELNILLHDAKLDNDWFFANDLSDEQRNQVLHFFGTLPLALERQDLRVVHACWDDESVRRIRRDEASAESAADLKQRYTNEIYRTLQSAEHVAAYDQEKTEFGDRINYGRNDPFDHWPEPIMLHAHAFENETYQMGNPVRVLTSGEERKAAKVFPAAGKFRFLNRISWWDHYDDDAAVVIGHYWRRYHNEADVTNGRFGPDLLAGILPQHWMGRKNNVYCIDFSVGARAAARAADTPEHHHKLAALCWPEKEVVFDDGERRQSE